MKLSLVRARMCDERAADRVVGLELAPELRKRDPAWWRVARWRLLLSTLLELLVLIMRVTCRSRDLLLLRRSPELQHVLRCVEICLESLIVLRQFLSSARHLKLLHHHCRATHSK